MDISGAYAAASAYAGYQPQPHHQLASQIVQATVAIQRAHKQLNLSISDSENNNLIRQVLQSSALLPTLFTQQLRTIETLEQKFGDQLAANCSEEIKEIANIAKCIQTTMESISTIGACVDLADQKVFAKSICDNTARLNVMQQRIAGKMMKVR